MKDANKKKKSLKALGYLKKKFWKDCCNSVLCWKMETLKTKCKQFNYDWTWSHALTQGIKVSSPAVLF